MTDLAYFVGQGKVYLAPRITGGAVSGGLRYLGDCESLQISTTQKFDDIEESVSGNRIVAAHIPIGTTMALKLNALQWSAKNLEAALYGTFGGAVAAGTVTAEIQAAYNNCMALLANPGVSAVVGKLAGLTGAIASVAVTAGGTGYTPGLNALTFSGSPGTGATGWAYANAAGILQSAFVVAPGSGYVAPTCTCATGTGATFQVNMGAASLVLNTDYTVDVASGAVTFLPGSLLVPAQPTTAQAGAVAVTPISSTWAYSYAAYTGRIEAVTKTQSEVSLVFVGLNVADSGNPVLVRVLRCSLDIAKTLDLIAAKHGNLEIGGMLLPDTSQPAGLSQYYNITKV